MRRPLLALAFAASLSCLSPAIAGGEGANYFVCPTPHAALVLKEQIQRNAAEFDEWGDGGTAQGYLTYLRSGMTWGNEGAQYFSVYNNQFNPCLPTPSTGEYKFGKWEAIGTVQFVGSMLDLRVDKVYPPGTSKKNDMSVWILTIRALQGL